MEERVKETTDWKKWLLKSSIPIEHAAASVLSAKNFFSWGEFAYIREDELSENKEFTVDLNCFSELNEDTKHSGLLELLIECKYSSEDIRWVFVPQPNNSQIDGVCIRYHDGLTGKKIVNNRFLFNFSEYLPSCIRGVALQSNSFDPNTISKATSQIRYALPHLLQNRLSLLLQPSFSEDLSILFFVGLVVTNAPLFVLKDNLTLTDINNSHKFSEVTEEVRAVTIDRDLTPLNYNQGKKLTKILLNENEDYRNRLNAFIGLIKDDSELWSWLPIEDNIEREIISSGDTVLIVSLKHLPVIVDEIINCVKNTLNEAIQLFELVPTEKRKSEKITLFNNG